MNVISFQAKRNCAKRQARISASTEGKQRTQPKAINIGWRPRQIAGKTTRSRGSNWRIEGTGMQRAIACSKFIIETLEQGVKYIES